MTLLELVDIFYGVCMYVGCEGWGSTDSIIGGGGVEKHTTQKKWVVVDILMHRFHWDKKKYIPSILWG